MSILHLITAYSDKLSSSDAAHFKGKKARKVPIVILVKHAKRAGKTGRKYRETIYYHVLSGKNKGHIKTKTVAVSEAPKPGKRKLGKFPVTVTNQPAKVAALLRRYTTHATGGDRGKGDGDGGGRLAPGNTHESYRKHFQKLQKDSGVEHGKFHEAMIDHNDRLPDDHFAVHRESVKSAASDSVAKTESLRSSHDTDRAALGKQLDADKSLTPAQRSNWEHRHNYLKSPKARKAVRDEHKAKSGTGADTEFSAKQTDKDEAAAKAKKPNGKPAPSPKRNNLADDYR